MTLYRASWLWATALSVGLTACAALPTPSATAIDRRVGFVPTSSPMTLGGWVTAPYQHIELCAQDPRACPETTSAASGDSGPSRASSIRSQYWRAVFGMPSAPDPSRGIKLQMDAARWALITRVNRDVNDEVHYQSDLVTYGRADVWALPTQRDGALVGDCKDIALEKRRRLISAGLPAGSLALTLVRTRERQAHAVLTVITDRGDYVLDNRMAWPSAWRDLAYTWIERESPQAQAVWVRLSSAG